MALGQGGLVKGLSPVCRQDVINQGWRHAFDMQEMHMKMSTSNVGHFAQTSMRYECKHRVMHIRFLNSLTIVPADAITPNSARLSASTLTSFKISLVPMLSYNLCIYQMTSSQMIDQLSQDIMAFQLPTFVIEPLL